MILKFFYCIYYIFYISNIIKWKCWYIFFNITIPLLAPTIILTSIVNVMSAFKVYDSLFVLYGAKPGPAFNLYTVIYYLYDQFWNKNKLGYAAASAMILFVIIALFTLLQNLITRKTNYYN